MVFFYVRHGDPIYKPDCLTPLGKRQAEAVAKRLALFGIDRIYASTSNRAIETATPTAEITKKEITLLDFANEAHAWHEFTFEKEDGSRTWAFQDRENELFMAGEEIVSLGDKWYENSRLAQYKKGIDRVYNDVYEFFKSLGYEHIKGTRKYKVIKHSDERVALFAHQGFGMAFLSVMLNIPYPLFATHFAINLSGVTAINFVEVDGYAIPKIITHSSDSHLYREGLPVNF